MDPNDDQEVNRRIFHDSTEQAGGPEHLHRSTRVHRDHQEGDYIWIYTKEVWGTVSPICHY